MALLHLLLRSFFVILLLASATVELLDMPGFYQVVASYQLLPKNFVLPFCAWLITLSELGLALWLWRSRLPTSSTLQSSRALACLAVLGLHFLYFAWLSTAYLRGLDIPNCGCFGVYFPRPLSLETLMEDRVLILCAIVLLWSTRFLKKRDQVLQESI